MSSPQTSSRRRREESARVEHALKTHLSWLSDEQKAELKADNSAGKTREEMKEKVMKWCEEIREEVEKEKARELLKGGCREFIKEVRRFQKSHKLCTRNFEEF